MPNNTFVNDLANYLGQTVTIFTTSGGQSGMGFTGILASVNCDFVRLVTQIGPAPGCALGNCCGNMDRIPGKVAGVRDECNNVENNELAVGENNYNNNVQGVQGTNLGGQGRASCHLNDGLGSIVDIPISRIASFVHNSVGSDGF